MALAMAAKRARSIRFAGARRHTGEVPIRPDVPFHPETPRVALLGRGHFRVALLRQVLGRGWGGDGCGVLQRASAQQLVARSEIGVYGGEEGFAEVVCFQPVAEVQERGGIRHAHSGQVNAGELLEGLAVAEGVFEGFVSQTIPLLEEVGTHRRCRRLGTTGDGIKSAFPEPSGTTGKQGKGPKSIGIECAPQRMSLLAAYFFPNRPLQKD